MSQSLIHDNHPVGNNKKKNTQIVGNQKGDKTDKTGKSRRHFIKS